jgi:hypothetical protein
MDCRKCQTSTATPAKPAELPEKLASLTAYERNRICTRPQQHTGFPND